MNTLHISPTLRASYPFTSRWFTHHGLRQHYLDEGEGAPVVMLHGNPSWSFYYRRLVSALRDEYRLIVPDHMGCGLSDRPDDAAYAYTLAQRVDDLDALLAHLGVRDNITLVVHDWGGMIGMSWAARHPERVARLIVMNTAAFPLPETQALPWSLRLCRDTRLGAWLILHGNAFARGAAWLGCKRKRMHAELRQAYCSPYRDPQSRLATLRFVQDIPLQEGDPAWAMVNATAAALPQFRDRPVLIGWGERDFVFTRAFLDRWLHAFPEAELHAFKDGGHYILEDAAELLIPRIIDFLHRHDV